MSDATAAIPATDQAAGATAGAASSVARPAGRTLWGEPLRRLLLVAVGLLVAAVALSVPISVHVKGVSTFDETTHADYAWQISHGHIPARGDILSKPIRDDAACRGVARDPHAPKTDCGVANLDPRKFGGGGQNYNFGHPPLYYLLTGVFARVVSHPFSTFEFITVARIAGALWLFAAMLVLYVALRRLGVGWKFALCGGLLLPCVPSLLYASSTVTNDAAAALGGSITVLLIARIFVDRKVGWIVPATLTAAVTATKIVNALPELCLAVFLLILAWLRSRNRAGERGAGRQYLFPAIGMIGGAFVVYEGWSVFQKHRGVAHWVNPIQDVSSQVVHGFPFDALFGTTFASYNVLNSAYLPQQLANDWSGTLVRLTGVLGIVAVGVVLVLEPRWSPRFLVAAVATLGCLTYPWAVELQSYVSTHPHRYFPVIIPRYGLSFASVLVGIMAIAGHDKNLRKTFFGFTGAALAVTAYTVFGAS